MVSVPRIFSECLGMRLVVTQPVSPTPVAWLLGAVHTSPTAEGAEAVAGSL